MGVPTTPGEKIQAASKRYESAMADVDIAERRLKRAEEHYEEVMQSVRSELGTAKAGLREAQKKAEEAHRALIKTVPEKPEFAPVEGAVADVEEGV